MGFFSNLRCKDCGGSGNGKTQSILDVDWTNNTPEYIEVKDGDHSGVVLNKIKVFAICKEVPNGWQHINASTPLGHDVWWVVGYYEQHKISGWTYQERIDALYEKTDTPGLYKICYQKGGVE